MDVFTLTKGEQYEIEKYIRDRIEGNEIDLDKIPNWLRELEIGRRKLRELYGDDRTVEELLSINPLEKIQQLKNALRKAQENSDWQKKILSDFEVVVQIKNSEIGALQLKTDRLKNALAEILQTPDGYWGGTCDIDKELTKRFSIARAALDGSV